MLTQLLDIVKVVAQREIVPRYLKVAHERKVDGSIITAADTAAQQALSEGLHALNGCPVLGEEMTPEEQQALWAHRDTGLWARAIQHELDHLDGILFLDRVPSPQDLFVHVRDPNGETTMLPYPAVMAQLTKSGSTPLPVSR